MINVNKILRILAATLACILCVAGAGAQTPTAPQDTAGRLQIETAEVVEYFSKGNQTTQQLTGNVRLRQENTLVYCDQARLTGNDATLRGHVIMEQGDSVRVFSDSAFYNGTTRLSDLFGDVVLVNGQQTLFTSRLQYNLASKVATYHNGATLTNGKSQLKSKHGYYYVNDKQVYFRSDVLVTDPEFTLRTDTLVFNTETQIARFVAPTLISQPDTRIYTEGGFYDIENKFAVFDVNPQYERDGQRGKATKMRYDGNTNEYILEGNAYIEEPKAKREVTADVIRYDTDTEQAVLTGNAHYRDSTQDITGEQIRFDSRAKRYQLAGRGRVVDPPNILEADSLDFNDQLGNGLALGNVIWRDTAADVSIYAYRLDYNKLSQYINAFGSFGERGAAGRPLMKTLLDRDTLYLTADTLTSYKPDTLTDNRLLLAYPDVRIFKSNLQGRCDSLSFSSADSIFHFFRLDTLQPVLWSDTSQFSGDTIRVRLKNKRIDQIWLRQNSFVINSEDSKFFNQIKGRNCTAQFREDQIREMFVEGNAQAVYYALDERDAYLGVNETQCSEMRLFFTDNKLEGIRFYTEPTGLFTPMRQAGTETKKLEGFIWEEKRRPRRLSDLF